MKKQFTKDPFWSKSFKMKIIMQATIANYEKKENLPFLTSLADIEVVELYRPSWEKFLLAFTYITEDITKKISMKELTAFSNFLPVFRINVELQKYKDNDITNRQYDTPLASLYMINKESLVESAQKLFVSISDDYFAYHDININSVRDSMVNEKR